MLYSAIPCYKSLFLKSPVGEATIKKVCYTQHRVNAHFCSQSRSKISKDFFFFFQVLKFFFGLNSINFFSHGHEFGGISRHIIPWLMVASYHTTLLLDDDLWMGIGQVIPCITFLVEIQTLREDHH